MSVMRDIICFSAMRDVVSHRATRATLGGVAAAVRGLARDGRTRP